MRIFPFQNIQHIFLFSEKSSMLVTAGVCVERIRIHPPPLDALKGREREEKLAKFGIRPPPANP